MKKFKIRFKFTIRFLLILIALIALGLWGRRMFDLRKVYLEKAAVYAELEASYRNLASRVEDRTAFDSQWAELRARQRKFQRETRLKDQSINWDEDETFEEISAEIAAKAAADRAKRASDHRAEADHFSALKRKYAHAARFPWTIVEPDPPEPRPYEPGPAPELPHLPTGNPFDPPKSPR